MIGLLTTAGAAIIEGVSSWWNKRNERKLVEHKSKMEIEKAKATAKIELMKTDQKAAIAWEQTAIENSGWKDEYFALILSFPAILSFIPGLAPYVREGFAALDTTPDWYQWGLMVAIGAAFGYRKIADFMAKKKMGL